MHLHRHLYLILLLISCWLISSSVAAEWERPESKPKHLISIDLGSTNTVVNIIQKKMTERVKILADRDGRMSMPSVVAFTNNGILVGESAKDQYVSNPTNTIIDVGRFLGRRFVDPIIQETIQNSQLTIKETTDGFFAIEVEANNQKKLYTPEEIVAELFKAIKLWSMTIFTSSEDLPSSTIAISDHDNENRQQAVRNAGNIAGLNFIRIIDPLRAAVLAYRIRDDELNILVYHLGGNTFQLALFEYDGGKTKTLGKSVLQLGGSNFDRRVVDYFVEKYKRDHDGADISRNLLVLDKLRRQVENAKILLSNSTLAHIEIHDPYFGDNNNNTFNEILTLETFEQLNQDLFDKSIQHIKDLLLKTNMTKLHIDSVVLSGGSTHIAKISALVQKHLSKKIYNRADPIDVIAYGSGVRWLDLFWGDYNFAVSLLEFTEISLGIEASGGVMAKILPRFSGVPVRRSLIFSTSHDNQTSVNIRVFEGERILTKYNTLMHEFNITDIQPTPRATSLIEVTFEINVNGLLRVTAKDLQSGYSVHVHPTVPRFPDNDDDYYDQVYIPWELDREADGEIKEQIESQCIVVDDPDIKIKLKDQKIWQLPSCEMLLLDPIENNSPYSKSLSHDEL